ncbi:MAG: hypothetical protein HY898_26465 [Deltaproteobacteria bacterium]|nr:hypothetical protein [Deltaproteobacteria bacterium]
MLTDILPVGLRPSTLLMLLATVAPLTACATSDADTPDAAAAGSGGAAPQGACDPLAPKAITLGEIVGVGKDAPGTLYVDSAHGIFLSLDAQLVRQHVIGSGQSGSNEYLFTFVSQGADTSTSRNLLVETTGATATAMGLGPSSSKAFLDESDAGVTMLTLEDPSTVAGMPVVNTPSVIQYVADVSNGDVLLTTRPMNGEDISENGGFSVFYGPSSAVAQRVITSFEQTLSGNGTMTFLVGSVPYVLSFGMVTGPDSGPLGDFALQSLTPQGGAALGVTLRSPTPTEAPAGLSFTCLP